MPSAQGRAVASAIVLDFVYSLMALETANV
jgi:hypothetical protein